MMATPDEIAVRQWAWKEAVDHTKAADRTVEYCLAYAAVLTKFVLSGELPPAQKTRDGDDVGGIALTQFAEHVDVQGHDTRDELGGSADALAINECGGERSCDAGQISIGNTSFHENVSMGVVENTMVGEAAESANGSVAELKPSA
jgi:hypothetical protein